jgi:hypothetical protein
MRQIAFFLLSTSATHVAQAHASHMAPGGHWHASDTFGIVLVVTLALLLIFGTRR